MSLRRRRGQRWRRELAQRPRIWKYAALSTCTRVVGEPRRLQPVLLAGPGAIAFAGDVQLGWPDSPHFYSGYCYLEATTPESRIELADGVEFNNNAMLKSEGPGIRVGRNSLFGVGVEIFDSDFHDLSPDARHDGTPSRAPVTIGENVFVGNGVRILKGVTIGDNSVIGAGAVVTSRIPPNAVAAGNPARVFRALLSPEPARRALAIRQQLAGLADASGR